VHSFVFIAPESMEKLRKIAAKRFKFRTAPAEGQMWGGGWGSRLSGGRLDLLDWLGDCGKGR